MQRPNLQTDVQRERVTAELTVDDSELIVRLGRWESIGAMRGTLRIPVAQVLSARAVPDAWAQLRGIRAPGTGWPGVIALGTRRGSFGKDFTAVYRHGPAVVVELGDAELQRLVVTTDHAETVAANIQRHSRRPAAPPPS